MADKPTTVIGLEFYNMPMAHYVPKGDGIGLPGLGKKHEKLNAYGYKDAAAVFGLYLSLNRNKDAFLSHLIDKVGVNFVGGGKEHLTVEQVKDNLIHALDCKWKKIGEY